MFGNPAKKQFLGLSLALSALLFPALCLQAADQPASQPAVAYPTPPQGFDRARDGADKGKVEKIEYDSKTAGAKRPAQVYTPPGYSKDKKYPVFYLIHGAGQNETNWVNEGKANVILDNLLADKKMDPMIVVFPNGSVSAAGAAPAGARRGGEPATAPAGAPAPAARRGGGGGGMNFDAFSNDLLKDLIPYIEANYSVIPDANHRALAGLSMGGMQTRAIAPTNSDKFAYLGIFSGGNLRPQDIPDMAAFKKNVKLLYMSFGANESSAPRGGAGADPSGPEGIKLAQQAMISAGLNASIYVSPGSGHDFTTWKRSLYYFAPMLFQTK